MKKTAKTRTTKGKKPKKFKQYYPRGWNAARVQKVIDYYDNLTDDELAADIERAREIKGQTMISVPTELVPKVVKMIARHEAKK